MERRPATLLASAVRMLAGRAVRRTAMHLLQDGVYLSVIAVWLGHESIQPTHQYLNADLDAKRRALDQLPAPLLRRPKSRHRRALGDFLRDL